MAHYTVFANMKDEVCKKIKHIVKKCVKNNVPCEFNVSDVYEKNIVDKETKNTYSVSVCDIDVEAHFKYNDWTVLGMVQRKDGIIQCYFDDECLINRYKNTDFHCDHCRKHVHRNSIVVLENEQHERKIVGTSCVKEFTSGLDGNLIAMFNEYTRFLSDKDSELNILLQGESLDDYPISAFYDSTNVIRTYSVEKILSVASVIIDKYGWEPAGSMNATWKMVYEYVDDDSIKIEDEAIKAIEWIKSLKEGEFGGSYLFNIRQIVDAEYCSAKFFSLIVSLIPTFRKHERNRLLNEQKEKIVSSYVGEVGDKISKTMTYITSYSYQSRFGGGFFHVFADDNGNIFKWSTGKGLASFNKGSKVELTGKVKGYEEYRGEKQTVLTRCKLNKIENIELMHESNNNPMNYLNDLFD